MSPDVVVTVVPIILFLVGVGMIYFGHRARARAKASAAWPKVAGTVTESRVVLKRRSKGGSRFVPTLQYVYDVAGQRHTGSRLAFGTTERAREAAAQAAIAPYPVGGTVQVSYDPADPSVATLDTSTTGTLVLPGLGWFFVVVSTLMGVFFRLMMA